MNDVGEVAERLAGFGAAQRRWLLAIALEERLPKSSLLLLVRRLGDDEAAVPPFVTAAISADLLVHAGLVHSPSPRRPTELREPCYAVPADARQLVLRQGIVHPSTALTPAPDPARTASTG
jgi:hypothetical protein